MNEWQASRPDVPPGRRGYRWPAEWERHRATWLSWPHNRETWPSGLGPVEDAFCEIVRGIIPGEAVKINVEDAGMEARVRKRLTTSGIDPDSEIEFRINPTDDSWVRDYGGIFLLDSASDRLIVDFEFDAWGGKYPPWDRDAEVARAMAIACDIDSFCSDYVLEAGGIDGDGQGTVLATESCLLNPNRARPGQDRSRGGLENLLANCLGTKSVIWLGEGIEGDDTDGHVDDLTRFVSAGRVVSIVENDPSDANFSKLAENRRRLELARDAAGRRLEIVELPTPGRIEGREGRLPASYANFYIANAAVLVPIFDVAADREALSVLEDCFADRSIIPIPSRALVEGLGSVHCLTQQEPEPLPLC